MNRIVGSTLVSAALALGGCTEPETRHGPEDVLAGWYWQSGEQGLFQSCGQSRQWAVASSEALREGARAFGLEPEMPVYVRVVGKLSSAAGELVVSRIEQFGSPTPVRNCPMTGVVAPSPTD